MAIPSENSATKFSGFEVHTEAIQTVVPVKPTDPRRAYRVLIPDTHQSVTFQRRFEMIMCHKALEEDFDGWILAGWFKDSLGRALAEQPIFAGRLRRRDLEAGGGELEIKPNDSGVRLVEASTDMRLAEFLDLKEKEEAEAELVSWEDIDEQNPQFSPHFYVQVTNFKCGGFSIGISCSLLVADPFSLLSFLHRWSEIHKNMVPTGSGTTKIPIFYVPNLTKMGCYPSLEIDRRTGTKPGRSMIFSTETIIPDIDDEFYKNLAAECLNEAEQKLGRKTMGSTFLLFLKEPSGDFRMESCAREAIYDQERSSPVKTLITGGDRWDSLGVGRVSFRQGNNPCHVSSWINSSGNEGGLIMMILPSGEEDGLEGGEGMKVIVTVNS